MTRGVDHFVKEYHFGERKFWFMFWVLGGQYRWRFFQQDLCRGADAFLFIFDLTRTITLQNVNEFLRIL
jgi:signal recognition particle receptor subunit beta